MPDGEGGDAERVLRVLMRFGLDESSAKAVQDALRSQSKELDELIRRWDELKADGALTEREIASMLQKVTPWLRMNEQQVLAIGQAWERQQAAIDRAAMTEINAAKAAQQAEVDRLKAIEQHTKQIAQSFTDMIGAGRFLKEIGAAGGIFGGLLGDEDLKKIGMATAGVGDLVMAVGRLPQIIRAIQATGGIVGAVLGGAGVLAAVMMLGKIVGDIVTAGMHAVGLANIEEKVNALQRITDAVNKLPEEARAEKLKEIGDALAGLSETEKVAKLNEMADAMGDVKAQAEEAKKQLDEAAKAFERMSAGQLVQLNIQIQSLGANAVTTGQQLSGMLGGLVAGFGVMLQQGAAGAAAKSPAVQAFIDYQKAMAEAQTQANDEVGQALASAAEKTTAAGGKYTDALAKLNADFDKQAAKAAATYERSRLRAMTDFADSEAKAERQYYKDRMKRAAQFGQDTERMEADHQRELRRMLEDHEKNVRKLANARDALGLEDEQDRYETERRRSEEDYGVTASRRNADYGAQLQEMEANFAAQRAERTQEQRKRLDEMKAQYDEEGAQRAQNKKDREKELADTFAEEQKQIADDRDKKLKQINDRMRDEQQTIDANWTVRRQQLGLWLAGEQMQFYNYMAARQADLQTWINAHLALPGGATTTTTTTPRRKQFGGYTDDGMYQMHRNEFVLSPGTTRAAEKTIGGTLSQDAILSALGMPSGRGGATVNAPVNLNINVSGAGDAAGAVRDEVMGVMDDWLRRVEQLVS